MDARSINKKPCCPRHRTFCFLILSPISSQMLAPLPENYLDNTILLCHLPRSRDFSIAPRTSVLLSSP
jgi:hypothetical protein